MNADPSRVNPDDDPTVAATVAADTGTAGTETTTAAAFDLVESIALEAVTAAASPPADDDRTMTFGSEGDDSSESAPIAPGEADPMVGRRIGPYELLARIGGGGMGTVYRAARVEDFRQEVAVKLIQRGMDSDAIVRRFHNEIHVQAALGKHPNIVGLLDAATTEDGRPFLVMEYVDGQRIDAYCDGRRLDLPARLGLFDKVCGAVHFAAPARGDPPRPGAEQYPGHLGRSTQAHRLRDRQADPSRSRRAGLDPGVRQPRADQWGAGHDGQRRLRAGGRALPAPDGPSALSAQGPDDIGGLPGHLRASARKTQRGGRATAGSAPGSSAPMPSGPPSEPSPVSLPAPPPAPTPEEIAAARAFPRSGSSGSWPAIWTRSC